MYTCNVCRQNFEGTPARISGHNQGVKWCDTCHIKVKEKARITQQAKQDAIAARNKCLWCDDPLTAQNRAAQKAEDHNNNMCVDCDSKSKFRQQLEKWLTAVGVKDNAAIIDYLALPQRQQRWEAERERKRLLEQATLAPNLFSAPTTINQNEWTEFQEFLRWKQMKEQK